MYVSPFVSYMYFVLGSKLSDTCERPHIIQLTQRHKWAPQKRRERGQLPPLKTSMAASHSRTRSREPPRRLCLRVMDVSSLRRSDGEKEGVYVQVTVSVDKPPFIESRNLPPHAAITMPATTRPTTLHISAQMLTRRWKGRIIHYSRD